MSLENVSRCGEFSRGPVSRDGDSLDEVSREDDSREGFSCDAVSRDGFSRDGDSLDGVSRDGEKSRVSGSGFFCGLPLVLTTTVLVFPFSSSPKRPLELPCDSVSAESFSPAYSDSGSVTFGFLPLFKIPIQHLRFY